jgi:hypothetical protein
MFLAPVQHRNLVVEIEELLQRQQTTLKPDLRRARDKMAEVNRKLFVV